MRQGWVAGSLGFVAVGVAGWLTWAFWPTPPQPPNWAAEYDLDARPPEQLPPGTVVGDGPPAGWSHLVIKSHPRVQPAYRNRLLPLVVDHAAWLCTMFAADVAPESSASAPRYRLRAVGLGLGTRLNGRDTVLTPETAAEHGCELTTFTRQILERGQAVQKQAVLVLRGQTMGLLDTPVWFRIGAKNQPVRYRYALLVDANTGQLDVLLWRLDAAGVIGDAGKVAWLAPNTLDESDLVPDMDEFGFGGIPNPAAGERLFGVASMPSGRATLTLPPDLMDLAGKTRFTANEARALEAGLRKLIAVQ